jgi:hypothetical protein
VQNRISEVQSAALSPLHLVKNLMKGSPKDGPGEPAEELQNLRKRIAELEGGLQQSKGKKKMKRRSATA